MKKAVVFRSSPRKNGNTNSMTDIVVQAMRASGCDVAEFDLFDMEIKPCIACRACQKDWSAPSCVQDDDLHLVFDAIMKSDMLILSSPVYAWYCTPPMKAMLDRLVYAMNMYYGEEKGPSLWAGKKVALIMTGGYRREKAADLFEKGIRRYCKHSRLEYVDMLFARHMGYGTVFMDDEKAAAAKAFGDKLAES